MNRCRLLVSSVVLVLLCLIALSGRAETKVVPLPAIQWEYKVLFIRTPNEKLVEDALNKAGESGWELAGTLQFGTNGIQMICKRLRRATNTAMP